MHRQSYLKYILALLIFASNGIVASYISLNSYEIVLLKTLIGSLLLTLIFASTRPKLAFYEHKQSLLYLAISGVAMGITGLALFEAYQQIGVGIPTLIHYCGPVIVMALSPILFREKLTSIKICGFIAVLLGLFLVNKQAINFGQPKTGLIFAGISAITFAGMVIFSKKATDIVGLEKVVIQLICSFLTSAIFVWCKQGLIIHVEVDDWIPILILGIVNVGLGCYLYFSSISKLPAQTVAICGYLETLFALVLSALLLNERFSSIQMVGAVLIIGGTILGEVFVKKK